MKTIFYSFPVLLFVAIEGQAQLTLTKATNEPVSGDIHSMVSHDSTTAVPRNKGTGQTWNFTSFSTNSYTEVITYTTTASVPQSSLFPSATLASLRGANNKEFFQSSGSDWLFLGEYQQQSGEMFVLNNPALFMRWPVSSSSTFSDVASGNNVSGSNTVAITGTLSYEASGTGTVTLPGNIVHDNCLQITSTLVVVTGTGGGATTMTQIAYRYYSSARKFPIADIQYSSEPGSSEFSAYFDRSALAVGLKAHDFTGELILYPNPADDHIYIGMPDGYESANLEIRDVQGRTVLHSNELSVLNISGLSPGIYCVTANTEKVLLTKRFVIER